MAMALHDVLLSLLCVLVLLSELCVVECVKVRYDLVDQSMRIVTVSSFGQIFFQKI